MSEIGFVSSILFIVPAAYLAHKFYYLNKGINHYTQQVKSLSKVDPPQANLTLVHCQKLDYPPTSFEAEPSKVVVHQ
jgi:hypothetical protein